MAKKEEKVVEELQKEVPIVKSVDTKDEVKNEPLKVKTPKRKMKDLNESSKSKITKVDLSKPVKREDDKESEVTKVDLSEKKEEEVKEKVEVVEEVKEEQPKEESKEVKDEEQVIEEITDEEEKPVKEEEIEEAAEEIKEAVKESKETGKPLPENIQKVVDFMDETGGSLDDYVRLNQDYS